MTRTTSESGEKEKLQNWCKLLDMTYIMTIPVNLTFIKAVRHMWWKILVISSMSFIRDCDG